MRRALALALLIALASPAVAAAATCPRTSVAALENQVMCQVCGVPLSLATDAPQAQRERAFIGRLVARCQSEGQIKQALVAQFGPSVLADPPHKGFDVTAYLVPVLGLAVVAAGLATALRGRGAREPLPAPLAAGDAARVDAELERWQP